MAMTTSANTTDALDVGRAILAALDELPPTAPTACEGWTAHHVAAHLAAGASEIAGLAEESLDGQPERPTRGFEEREAPFRALPHDELLRRLVSANLRKLAAYAALDDRLSDPAITFTGTRITVEELTTHSRSEATIHRWDLVGDDDLSTALLAAPELTAHAVKILNRMPVLDESSRALAGRVAAGLGGALRILLRSPDRPDVVFEASGEGGRLTVGDAAAEPAATVTTDAANRLLVLWGRRSSNRQLAIEGDPALTDALHAILWPNARPWG